MTERLPDTGEAGWAGILGARDTAGGFLKVAHNDDGTLKGVGMIYAKALAWDDAHLSDGVGEVVYTPAVGDLLLDAWVEVDTAFDGTTPLLDIGTGVVNAQGLMYVTGGVPVDMTLVDEDGVVTGAGLLTADDASTSNMPYSAIRPGSNPRRLPAKFTATDPLRVWVTQDGLINGADPVCTQGVAFLYVVIAQAITL